MKRLVVVALTAAWAALGTVAMAAEGRIVVDGSTTVGPIAKQFAQYYMSKHPEVNVTVSESGSGNGAKSLINGTCDVADMSRFMKDNEFQAAVAKGILPVAHVVAVDGLADHRPPEQSRQGTHDRTDPRHLPGQDHELVGVGRAVAADRQDRPRHQQRHLRDVRATRDAGRPGFRRHRDDRQQRRRACPGAEHAGGRRLRGAGVRRPDGQAAGGQPDRADTARRWPRACTRSPGRCSCSPTATRSSARPLHAFVTLYLSEKGQEIIEAIGFVPVTNY